MLTLTLRGLERDGLITRTVFPTIPPRVDYELTALGRSLLEPVNALERLGAQEHGQDRESAREIRRHRAKPQEAGIRRMPWRRARQPRSVVNSKLEVPGDVLFRPRDCAARRRRSASYQSSPAAGDQHAVRLAYADAGHNRDRRTSDLLVASAATETAVLHSVVRTCELRRCRRG